MKTPDGPKGRTLIKGTWNTEIVAELPRDLGPDYLEKSLQRLLPDRSARDAADEGR